MSLVSRLFFAIMCVFMIALPPAYAEEDASDKDVQVASIQDRVESLTKDFDDLSKQHFYAIYGSHNMIQVVESVREQVGDAVEKCGDNNPDLKDPIETRYEEWDDAIEPIMDDAQANVDNMIAAQDYIKPREIKNLLKYVDKVRDENNEALDKYPVTTAEACTYLLEKMDETQENLTGLLKSTLVSLPQTMIQDIEGKKAAQEAAEKEAEENAEE